MLRDYFYFNRQDRTAAIILLAVIVACHTARVIFPKKAPVMEVDADSLEWAPARQKTDSTFFRQYPVNTRKTPGTYQKSPAKRELAYEPQKTRDSVFIPRYQIKEAPKEKVDLNNADSLTLVSLPGIGAWTARRIMTYRNELGGFVRDSQLLEIEDIPDSLIRWFKVSDSVAFRKISINDESLNELRRHPYLNFYQAKAIVELRREYGRIKGPGQLSLLEEFSDRDLERLEPYLDFE